MDSTKHTIIEKSKIYDSFLIITFHKPLTDLNLRNFRLCCAAHMIWEQENVQMPCGRRDSHLLAFFLINHIKIRKKQKLEEPDFYLRKEMMTGSVTSNNYFFSVLFVIALTFVRPLVLSENAGRLFFSTRRESSAVGHLLTFTFTSLENHVSFMCGGSFS